MKIDCKFVDHFEHYKCIVTTGSIAKPAVKIRAFAGKHQEKLSNGDVSALEFSGMTLKYFPQCIDKLFVTLTSLEIEGCGLKTLSRDDLFGLENLQKLLIRSNHLKSLPSDLFKGMFKLSHISFFDNKLETLSSNLLKPINYNELMMVDFRKNTKIDSFYRPGYQGSIGIELLMETIDRQCTMRGFIPHSSDFTIFVQEVSNFKEYSVHKHVLGAQSSVFNHFFNNNQADKMQIKEFSSTTVSSMLEYLYTGNLPQEVNAMELFAIASRYKVKSLIPAAEEMVMRIIDQANALEVFNLANQYHAIDLKRASFSVIRNMFPEGALDNGALNKPVQLNKLMETKKTCDSVIREALKSFYTS